MLWKYGKPLKINNEIIAPLSHLNTQPFSNLIEYKTFNIFCRWRQTWFYWLLLGTATITASHKGTKISFWRVGPQPKVLENTGWSSWNRWHVYINIESWCFHLYPASLKRLVFHKRYSYECKGIIIHVGFLQPQRVLYGGQVGYYSSARNIFWESSVASECKMCLLKTRILANGATGTLIIILVTMKRSRISVFCISDNAELK